MRENRGSMIQSLQDMLRGKRYLLVLDDVWNVVQWESLKSSLSHINTTKGNKIKLGSIRRCNMLFMYVLLLILVSFCKRELKR